MFVGVQILPKSTELPAEFSTVSFTYLKDKDEKVDRFSTLI